MSTSRSEIYHKSSIYILDGWVKTNTGEYKIFNVNYGDQCSRESGCTWRESKSICENNGGNLVKISSQEENDMIEKIIDRINPNKIRFLFYLGLNDLETEGVYKWTSDDSQMTFNNFYRGRFYKKGNSHIQSDLYYICNSYNFMLNCNIAF